MLHGLEEGRWGHPRFDVAYYQSEEEVDDDENAWVHYLEQRKGREVAWNRREGLRLQLEAADALEQQQSGERRPADRSRELITLRALRSSGLFHAQHYQACWGAEIEDFGDAARHFLERGSVEGVEFCPPDQLVTRLQELESELANEARPEFAYLRAARRPVAAGAARHARVTLYVSSRGNSFFREMAELLELGFRSIGAEVAILDESTRALPPEGRGEHAIVIAPHEFFLLGEGPRHLSRGFLSRVSLWVAEQPGSEFFAMCFWFARFARGVLDINPLTAVAWNQMGVHARALPLGWLEGFPAYADGLEIEAPLRARRPDSRGPRADPTRTPACRTADRSLLQRRAHASARALLCEQRLDLREPRVCALHADVARSALGRAGVVALGARCDGALPAFEDPAQRPSRRDALLRVASSRRPRLLAAHARGDRAFAARAGLRARQALRLCRTRRAAADDRMAGQGTGRAARSGSDPHARLRGPSGELLAGPGCSPPFSRKKNGDARGGPSSGCGGTPTRTSRGRLRGRCTRRCRGDGLHHALQLRGLHRRGRSRASTSRRSRSWRSSCSTTARAMAAPIGSSAG